MGNRQSGWKLFLWAGLVLGLAAPAAAQSNCASDADCELGYSCEVVGMNAGCAVAPCMEGSDCPPVECQEAEEILGCVPSTDCASDADCAEGFTCLTREYESCVMVAYPDCPEDADCEPVEPSPAECETITESACVPRYQAPCTVNADCGAGFKCEEVDSCWCTGGGAMPEPAPGEEVPVEPVMDEPDCGCEPTGEFACRLIETECETDADCASGLTCQSDPNGVVCGGMTDPATPQAAPGAPPLGGYSDGSGGTMEPTPLPADGADGGVDVMAEEPPPQEDVTCPEPRTLCLPPNYVGEGANWLEEREASTQDGGQVPTGAPAPQPAGDNNGGTMASPTDADSTTSGSSPGSIGCSVARAQVGFSQLALVGLSLFSLRRRRRS